MTWWPWVVLVLVVVVGLYLQQLAGRLDRLHIRVEAAQDALDAQLVRRALAAVDVAHAEVLDPASSMLLAAAVDEVQREEADGRELAESELSQALRAAFPDQATMDEVMTSLRGRTTVLELRAACERVVLARRFHNDAVRATQAMRRRRLVRWFRLAGRAPFPQPFEMDDAPPPPFPVVR